MNNRIEGTAADRGPDQLAGDDASVEITRRLTRLADGIEHLARIADDVERLAVMSAAGTTGEMCSTSGSAEPEVERRPLTA